MTKEAVKARMVAGSLVVTIPSTILKEIEIKAGDMLIVEPVTPEKLTLTVQNNKLQNPEKQIERKKLEIEYANSRLERLKEELKLGVDAYNEGASGYSNEMFGLYAGHLRKEIAFCKEQINEKKIELLDLEQ